MAEKQTSNLSEWVAVRRPKNHGILNFLSLSQEVEAAMRQGYSLRTIWEFMSQTGKISTRYETFLRHVNQYLPKNRGEAQGTRASGVAGQSRLHPSSGATAETSTANSHNTDNAAANNLPSFSFNPVPNKRELF